MKRGYLVISFLISITNIGYSQCELDIELLVPKKSSFPHSLSEGQEVLFNTMGHEKKSWEREVFKYEFSRQCKNKELKNSKKVSTGFYIIDSSLYSLRQILGPHIFFIPKNLEDSKLILNIDNSSDPEAAWINPSLIQIDSIVQLQHLLLKVEFINNKFVLFNSTKGRIVYVRDFYSSGTAEILQMAFKNPVDSAEMKIRSENSQQFYNKNIKIGTLPHTLSIGRIVDIEIEPFFTRISLQVGKTKFDYFFESQDSGKYLCYDADCSIPHKYSSITTHSNEGGSQNSGKQRTYESTPSTSVQCSGRTQKGARCKRMTTSSSGRCYQH